MLCNACNNRHEMGLTGAVGGDDEDALLLGGTERVVTKSRDDDVAELIGHAIGDHERLDVALSILKRAGLPDLLHGLERFGRLEQFGVLHGRILSVLNGTSSGNLVVRGRRMMTSRTAASWWSGRPSAL